MTTRRWTCLWLIFWAMMFTATHIPTRVPQGARFPHADKVVHFGMFFLLAWIGGRRLHAATGLLAGGALVGWAVVYAAYAFIDEWLQPFVGRSMTLGDWLADAGGIIAATVLLAVSRQKRTLSEPPSDRS